MTTDEQVRCVRSGAGLFALPQRGLIEVTGRDRVRWLNGMLSNDVSKLEAGSERSGCYALLLTVKGAITADLHVMLRPDSFWLETARDVVPAIIARLERYIVADDVGLADLSDTWERIGIEGPAAAEIVSQACGETIELSPDSCQAVSIAGATVVVGAFGWSGEVALQLFVEAPRGAAVREALQDGALGVDIAEIGGEALEILRIEAGTPLLGRELGEDVLPDEAGLDRAISTTKGCYTGQEIVARLRSRGHVNHRLVGLEFAGELPQRDAEIHNDKRRTGEIMSSCVSPSAGKIALGFVRLEDAEVGTRLTASGSAGVVVALPFVAPSPARS